MTGLQIGHWFEENSRKSNQRLKIENEVATQIKVMTDRETWTGLDMANKYQDIIGIHNTGRLRKVV